MATSWSLCVCVLCVCGGECVGVWVSVEGKAELMEGYGHQLRSGPG